MGEKRGMAKAIQDFNKNRGSANLKKCPACAKGKVSGKICPLCGGTGFK